MGKEICKYIDKYGDERIIHSDGRGRLYKKFKRESPILKMNQVIGVMLGEKIGILRRNRGMTLSELCIASGIVSSTPKSRMWEIESGSRREGLRLGTLYAIAEALDVEVGQLLPSKLMVFNKAKIAYEISDKKLIHAIG